MLSLINEQFHNLSANSQRWPCVVGRIFNALTNKGGDSEAAVYVIRIINAYH
jgi:hypothetical protein